MTAEFVVDMFPQAILRYLATDDNNVSDTVHTDKSSYTIKIVRDVKCGRNADVTAAVAS